MVGGTRDEPWASPESPRLDLFDVAPDGIVIVDEDGLIVTANERAGGLFGYAPGELTGEPLESLIPKRFRSHHADLAQDLHGPADPATDGGDAGAVRPPQERRGIPDRRESQRLSRCERPARSDRFRPRRHGATPDGGRAARASELLVDNVTDYAIFMLDPSGRVASWNRGAERIKGWSADEIIGRHFSVFYVPEDIAAGLPERDLERAVADGRADGEGWRVRAGGQRFWAETTLAAVRHENGTLRGFANVTRDRTESRQTRARLEAVADMNRTVLEGRPEDDVLAVIVGRARAMVAATLVAIWTPDAKTDALTVVCAEGDGAAMLSGTSTPRDSLLGGVLRASSSEVVSDLSRRRTRCRASWPTRGWARHSSFRSRRRVTASECSGSCSRGAGSHCSPTK